MIFGAPLSEADAAGFESGVAPRYLSFFAALAVPMILPFSPARVAYLGSRTGFPKTQILDRVPGAELWCVDPSQAALDVLRADAESLGHTATQTALFESFPVPFDGEAFTHTFALHPFGTIDDRAKLFAEMRRLLLVGGQAVIAMPLRGSFPELNDMLREYALRQDQPDLGKAVDLAASSRPNIETISEELESAGLSEVDVDVSLLAISFADGKEFTEDPISRLMVLPELAAIVGVDPAVMTPALRYACDAIQKYWSEGTFELTVNVGCASARRL